MPPQNDLKVSPMPIYLMFVFFSLVSSVSYGLSYYTMSRLEVLVKISGLTSYTAPPYLFTGEGPSYALLVGSTLLILMYFLVAKFLSVRYFRWLGWLSGVWMGYLTIILFYGGFFHLLESTLALVVDLPIAFQKIYAQLNLLIIHGVFAGGLWQASRQPLVKKVAIKHAELPSEFENFKILQLSDIHIGPTLGKKFIRHLHRLCDQANPDLIVMTGDLVDGEVRFLGEDVKEFLKIKHLSKNGMLLITGNHEYISGVRPWSKFLKDQEAMLLENDSWVSKINDQTLSVIGIEDWEAKKFDDQRRPQLSQALEKVPQDSFKILLAHQPKAAIEASKSGIHLQLSGHTHAGQIFPFSYLIYLDQPFNVGLYHLKKMQLYVNPGTGYWGPPLRIGTRAEITLLSLHREDDTHLNKTKLGKPSL